jgi:hypothetical protein
MTKNKMSCISCAGKDSQHRYAKMYDSRFDIDGWMCASCFMEWLGIEKSRQKERLRNRE